MIDNLSFLQPSNMPPKNMSPPAALSTMLKPYRLDSPENVGQVEQDTRGRLQYMASRLRAMLTALAALKDYDHEWWAEQIDYEMVFYFIFNPNDSRPIISQMISCGLLGQAALVGAYPPVPFLVRSVSQSMMVRDGAKKIYISGDMLDLLQAEVDPADPTQLFEEYLLDWWNRPGGEGFSSGDEVEEAYELHIKKVF